MEQLVFNTIHKLSTADVDIEARLRPGTLADKLIQAAVGSAESIGMGYTDLQGQELFWVLYRLTVEIARPLMLNETIRVETWPKDLDGLNYLRDFLVFDEAGDIIVRSTSGWLAVNRLTKRPSTVAVEQIEKLTSLKDRHALPATPDKLAFSLQGDHSLIRPTWFDFDINRHVTSSRYIDWMIDALPMDHLRQNYPSRLSINYLKEVKPGEDLRLTRVHDGPVCRFEGIKEINGNTAFRGTLLFKPHT
jgi:medium-chain acyl-[acyl-carrier-protein] hydrolase